MCVFLGNIYQEIYGEKFNYRSGIDKRKQMQKTIYLLERMGMNIGGYNFIWYKHGPYSQRLQDDSLAASLNPLQKVQFTERSKAIMNRMKDIISRSKETNYSVPDWLEAVASLDFLCTRRFLSDNEALTKLKEYKPHLNDDNANRLALSICQGLCASR